MSLSALSFHFIGLLSRDMRLFVARARYFRSPSIRGSACTWASAAYFTTSGGCEDSTSASRLTWFKDTASGCDDTCGLGKPFTLFEEPEAGAVTPLLVK